MTALVSVVTATWARPRTIREHAIPSVAKQTYPEIEHLVVMDGRDDRLEKILHDEGYTHDGARRRLICLGRNWSSFSGDGGAGATCRMVGAWLAAGEYIAYLDDDNDWLPDHVASMVATIEGLTGDNRVPDLVCSAWHYGLQGNSYGPAAGSPPPGVGRTDTSGIMHRARLLKTGGSWLLDGYEGDGRMVERWLAAGAAWRFKPEPTVVLNGYRHGAPDEVGAW